MVEGLSAQSYAEERGALSNPNTPVKLKGMQERKKATSLLGVLGVLFTVDLLIF